MRRIQFHGISAVTEYAGTTDQGNIVVMDDVVVSRVENFSDPLAVNQRPPKLLSRQTGNGGDSTSQSVNRQPIRLVDWLGIRIGTQHAIGIDIMDDVNSVAHSYKDMCQHANIVSVATKMVRRIKCSDHYEAQRAASHVWPQWVFLAKMTLRVLTGFRGSPGALSRGLCLCVSTTQDRPKIALRYSILLPNKCATFSISR